MDFDFEHGLAAAAASSTDAGSRLGGAQDLEDAVRRIGDSCVCVCVCVFLVCVCVCVSVGG